MPITRAKAVEEIRARLLRKGLPRLQMMAMLAGTGLAGFAASFVLLHAGVVGMSVRYPVAIAVAYLVFLAMLRLWLWAVDPDRRAPSVDLGNMDGDVDLPNVGIGGGGGGGGRGFSFGGKGDFAGGGAADGWSGPESVQAQAVIGGFSSTSGGSGGASGTSGGGGIGDLDLGDEGFWIVIAIVALAGVLIACGWVIYSAPVLFAEILVDGLLVQRLYKRMKEGERRYWLATAIRKTCVPVLVVMLFAGVVGYALGKITPGARTLGEVFAAPQPSRAR